MGVASLVLGIITIVLALLFGGVLGWFCLIPGILGIILAAIGKKKGAKCATGGLVCSIIGSAFALIYWLACVACVAAAGTL